jgi:hypothetical protein
MQPTFSMFQAGQELEVFAQIRICIQAYTQNTAAAPRPAPTLCDAPAADEAPHIAGSHCYGS